MARWLRLDGNLINLDQVHVIAEYPRADGRLGARFHFGGEDAPWRTSKSVDEVFRLIESLEWPEPPEARITDHDFDALLGAMYECAVCSKPKEMHAR